MQASNHGSPWRLRKTSLGVIIPRWPRGYIGDKYTSTLCNSSLWTHETSRGQYSHVTALEFPLRWHRPSLPHSTNSWLILASFPISSVSSNDSLETQLGQKLWVLLIASPLFLSKGPADASRFLPPDVSSSASRSRSLSTNTSSSYMHHFCPLHIHGQLSEPFANSLQIGFTDAVDRHC